jgi:hypothetical protein
MTQQKQHKDEINSQEDLKEIIAKIPAAAVNGGGKTGQDDGVKPGQPRVTPRPACLG